MRKLTLALLISTTIISSASAGCILQQAMSNLEFGYIRLRGENAKQMRPILDEMRTLPTGSNNSLPQGLQMTPRDLRRFEKLSFDMLVLRMQTMLLSAYQRDARVIAKMAELARNVRLGKEYKEGDPDYLYYGLLLITSVTGEGTDLNPEPSNDDCSVDSGLWMAEDLELKQMTEDNTGEKARDAWGRVLITAKLYNIDTKQQGWFDQLDKIPSFSAKQAAKRDLATAMDGVKALNYVKSIEALRGLNQVSIMIYTTHRQDIGAANDKGDLNRRFGSTWEAQLKVSDERVKRLEGVIKVLEEKVPSDSMIENTQMIDELKKKGLQ